jgi:hypothetical protein
VSGADAAVERVRQICMALPEVTERLSHGAPTWFIRGKKTFATVWADHHGDGHLGLVCPAPPGVQEELVATEPARFYRPAYVGHRGWIGVDLAVDPDWDEIAGVCADAYRTVAPKKLALLLDQGA